jgi:hypothetical protein
MRPSEQTVVGLKRDWEGRGKFQIILNNILNK